MRKTLLALSFLSLLSLTAAGCTRPPEEKQPRTDTPVEELSPKTQEKTEPTLFYSKTCPHCHETLAYMEQNDLEEKLNIQIKETGDQLVVRELFQHAKTCGISTDSIGVPFLWDGKTCYIGSPNIKAWLDTEIIKNNP